MTLIQVLESRREALTVQEVADLLGVSDKHIYEMIADGRLPAFHVGKSIRLDPQDVADWLRAKRPVASHTDKQKTSRVVQHIDQSQPGNGKCKASGSRAEENQCYASSRCNRYLIRTAIAIRRLTRLMVSEPIYRRRII